MRRRITWLLGALGIAGLITYLKRRGKPDRQEAVEADHAADLRRTLEETREQADQLEQRPTAEQAAPDEGELETRRQDVHDRGRSALDEMGPSGE
ncbi:MAG: hypothetical protein C5B48_04345 [Candidatus Rokuibacteriota bacterium]|nr:MAG: hypothetical protein C5B48_04345 [Candidatus Rokubacteria bacterium]